MLKMDDLQMIRMNQNEKGLERQYSKKSFRVESILKRRMSTHILTKTLEWKAYIIQLPWESRVVVLDECKMEAPIEIVARKDKYAML